MRKVLTFSLVVFFMGSVVVRPDDSSNKVSAKGQAHMEAQAIAVAITSLIADEGRPKDIKSVTKLLLGDNPDHTEYLYKSAFKLNSSGQICDPAGRPYVIEINGNTITVKSLAYDVVSNVAIDQFRNK